MADPATYRPAPGSIPESPGVYKFRDARGRVVYVGKAKNLRSRLNSYFSDFASLHPRTQWMLLDAASVEWTVVGTEVEALQLEYSWIKEFDPRWNIRYRDDKSYPYLAVTMDEEYPRVTVMRGAKRRGVRYFGPYSHAWAIRDTVDTLLRVFPVRTCSAGVFKRAGQIGRPCLLGYIAKCSAPCVGRVDAAEHRRLAGEFCDFMAGQTGKFTKRLESQMRQAAKAEEFELAARLRDDLQALQRALERQAVVLPDGTDCDVIGMVEDQLEAAVQVFYVRGGRVRGQRGWVVDKVEDVTAAELIEHFLGQVYRDDPVAKGDDESGRPDGDVAAMARGGTAPPGAPSSGDTPGPDGPDPDGPEPPAAEPGPQVVPREVLVPVLPPAAETVQDWLAARRGGKVSLRVPQRGDKKTLLDTVTRNAAESLALHKTKRASDLSIRSQAMQEIQDALGLDTAPLRMECFDVSHLQGTHVVAAMVVFEDGLARRSEYRKFAIKGADGTDDLAAIYEVVTRRFRRYLAESQEPPAELVRGGTVPSGAPSSGDIPDPDAPALDGLEPPAGLARGGDPPEPPAYADDDQMGGRRKFAYPPSLLVIDGGAGQVDAAVRALSDLGITDVAVCGLAKRLEEVWLPGEDSPVIMPRSSEGLYLLQRVRDEAHRFAITYHRAKRTAAQQVSELDELPGLGPARRAALLRHFGSVRKLRQATAEEIAEVAGFGPKLAEMVTAALRGRETGDATSRNGGDERGA